MKNLKKIREKQRKRGEDGELKKIKGKVRDGRKKREIRQNQNQKETRRKEKGDESSEDGELRKTKEKEREGEKGEKLKESREAEY